MPCPKPTRLQSTNREFINHMTLVCACTEDQAQNYPRPMAKKMAYMTAFQGMADDINDIYTAEGVYRDIGAIEYTDVMQELMKRFNVSTIRAVKRARVSLGHPLNASLAIAMQHAGTPAELIPSARLQYSEICPRRQRPRAIRVAVLPKAKRFNEVVCTNVCYITSKMKERKILVDCQILKETFLKEARLWQKLWISWASKPETMRMDTGGSHTSKRMHDWMSKHGIKLDLIPKGAHHKLRLMERNHAVRREQLSKYNLQFSDDSLKTALRISDALCDEDFGLSERAALMVRRTAAGTAFIEANCSRAVQAALLARSRPTRRNYEIGEWVYFCRPEQTQGLEKCHGHGPTLVVAVDAKVNEDNAMHTSVVWVTRGCTISRCTIEQLRPELPGEAREREGRGEDPDSPLSTIEKLRRVLKQTKGSCNCWDLAEDRRQPLYDDTPDDMGEQQQPSAQAPMETDETSEPTAGATAAAAPEDPQPAATGEDAAAETAVASASASGSAAQEPSRTHIDVMAKRSVEEAERLDGIPLAKHACLSRAKLAPQSEEAELAEEEKDPFYAAKLEALEIFSRNDGWEPIDEEEVDPTACCPLRFQLKWKMKDRGVAEGQLEKEAPTLSKLGRRTVMLWASLKKRRLFTADVKSAFLQAEDASVHGLKLYASPTKEMREMLSYQIGLQQGQLLKMIKPCFGDPRSPKLQHHHSDEVEDDTFDARNFEGQTYVVDGLIGKHMDDFIGGGEGVTNEQDLHATLDNTECFQVRLGALNEKFKFGKLEFGPSLIFTGGEVEQSLCTCAVTLTFEKYLHAVKPITIEKHRRADLTIALSPKELTSFRDLTGQLQWPATQGMIIAATTMSFRASATGRATVQDFLDAYKDLRFRKASADVGLYFGFDKAWSDQRVSSYTDASWASRHDGDSQGGHAIFVGPADKLNAGTPTHFVAVEWA
ncbi:unnamed protein product [Prorocentrum cordatum]|uniref:Reverse transcriptase Ty1/copia-type domain-containing protein n=1 Tax=Prorocentrum cordatum TaxID=2364126 RepID=A0ABN9SQQ2_9DINO|nr:unnamed protein product [Polarella glacialis]